VRTSWAKPYFLVGSFSHLSGSGPHLSQGLLGPGSLGDLGGCGAPVSGSLNFGLMAIERISFGPNYAVRAWLAELGFWAYVVAPLVMTIVAVLPIPVEASAMANGVIFGPVIGSIITWIGALAGAWISYEIAQAWGRPIAERVVGSAGLEKVGQVADDAGWWGLLVLRFIPLVAFTVLN
jgi:uncharacterized membrane protein YdjX (TVP38/TMEM64 family)